MQNIKWLRFLVMSSAALAIVYVLYNTLLFANVVFYPRILARTSQSIFLAGGSNASEQAYKDFQMALLQGNVERALDLVWASNREQLRNAISADPNAFAKRLPDWEKLTKGDSATFIYYWVNEHIPTTTIKIGGAELFVPAGEVSRRIYFKQNEKDKWFVYSIE